MSGFDKNYDPFSLFEELQERAGEILHQEGQVKKELQRAAEKLHNVYRSVSFRESFGEKPEKDTLSFREKSDLAEDEFYEIEYDSSPIPRAGKFVLRGQKIEPPVKDEVRDIFDQMREISRVYKNPALNQSRFYDYRVQQENARIFYEQGMFMKDFEDHYEKKITYSAYYPRYQMMGYDQLRTYFTWRTQVREGYVEKTSLSYAFMYLYELLNHIGAENPQDGLDKLLFFWKEFRVYDNAVDKYVLSWLKDYHIYYDLPDFRAFAEENNLAEFYPELTEMQDDFERLCSLAGYDVRKSKFFTEREEMIRECSAFLVERLKEVFAEKGLDFESFILQPVKNMPVWEPFKGALFYPWMKQRDRKVVLADKEVYVCSENRWYVHTTLTTEGGKGLLGYCMKQMERSLRGLTGYKYKITADTEMVSQAVREKLDAAGIDLEKRVTEIVKAFYREATRTVVKVDLDSLSRIRQEAYETQERLVVPEDMAIPSSWPMEEAARVASEVPQVLEEEFLAVAARSVCDTEETGPAGQERAEHRAEISADLSALRQEATGPWAELKVAFSSAELEALSILLTDPSQIKAFADAQGIMLEVLMDGINEKAMDYVGDSLFDEEFVLYDDYIEDVKEMVN